MNIQDHLVLNSLDYFYIFQLDNKETLTYQKYDLNYNLMEKKALTDKKVLNFSIALDNLQRINIVYLLKTGELYHKILQDSKWIGSMIGKYDTKSNRYNKLEILFIDGKLNIIYSYSNIINTNIYTIQHIIYDQQAMEQHNVVKYASSKIGTSFVADYDDTGTIHLLYNPVTNKKSYIYHCFYSPYRKSWSINPNELSNPKNNNIKPYIFIDSSSNIHCLWVEEKENRYNLQYKIMPTKGKNKYSWNSIKIPYGVSKDSQPIILEENGHIKVFYNHNNGKNYFLSPQGQNNTWMRKELPSSKDLFKLCISNDVYPEIQGKHIYAQLDDKPYIYLIEKIKESKQNKGSSLILKHELSQQNNIEEKDIEKEPQKVDLAKEDPLLEPILNEIKLLKDNIEKINSLIEDLKIKEEEMLNELNSLKKAFDESQSSFLERLFGKS